MKISDRSLNLGTENAFVVLAEVNELIKSGKEIISFCIGQPDFHTPVNIQNVAIDAIKNGKHGYTPSAGIHELRFAISDYFNRTRELETKPEEIVVAAGAKPFIMYSILATTDYDSGDEVIYPNPGFPIYESQIKAMGAKAIPLHLNENREFSVDPDLLEKIISKNTKLLILNSPHNPTGGIISDKDFDSIVQILKDYPNVWIFADEIYSNLCFEEKYFSISKYTSILDRLILCDGVSKTWAMTGWRIGFAWCPKLAEIFTKWITNTESCASHISQLAAVEALNGDQNEPKKMFNEFKKRKNFIVEKINQIPGITCKEPGGAFYIWPNITKACEMLGLNSAEEFRKELLEQEGVAVLSDIHFGAKVPNSGEHIRFSYAASIEEIEKGLNKLDNFIKNNKKNNL
jgi:aspartate/methionine/tyrosine aminotransferase